MLSKASVIILIKYQLTNQTATDKQRRICFVRFQPVLIYRKLHNLLMFTNIYIVFPWNEKMAIYYSWFCEQCLILVWYSVWKLVLLEQTAESKCCSFCPHKRKENQHKDTCTNPLRALRVQVHDLTSHPTYSLPLALEMVTLFSCVWLCGLNHSGIV